MNKLLKNKNLLREEKEMLKMMKNLVVEEEGQGLAEYGLIIGLVAVVCVAALDYILVLKSVDILQDVID